MIGRATMKNPWIFRQIADRLAGRPVREATLDERRDLMLDHFRRSRRTAHDAPGSAAQAADHDRLVHERPAARAGPPNPDLGARHAGGFPGRGLRLLRRAAGPRRGAGAGPGFLAGCTRIREFGAGSSRFDR